MANEAQVLRGINWREVFAFTHIFRAFRIAVHPSKLVLALAAVVCLYLGGLILDRVWPAAHRAVPGEVTLYERASAERPFVEERAGARRRAEAPYAGLLQQVGKAKQGDANYWIGLERSRMVKEAEGKYEQAAKGAAAEKKKAATKELESSVKAAYELGAERYAQVEAIGGRGLFEELFSYQRQQIHGVLNGVLSGNWLGGLPGGAGGDGVYRSAFKFIVVGPAWAIRHHWVYFVLYGAWLLAVLSVFGGAIARIAAVHVADEGSKLSIMQGLSFACSKFLSFLSAPLIPLVIVGGIGVLVAVVAFLAFLVWLDAIVGLFYFLALAAGFVMTLVLLGAVGGGNLMYPTIAVEGSDSFDAISRSFSYIYSRPWRMLFYSSVALGYGALCYVFVRVFIWLTLLLAHVFVGLLVFGRSANLDSLWTTLHPMPSFAALPFTPQYVNLSWYGDVTAFLISIWVHLVIAILGAFAISFYYSANTIIYYLIRRDADGTEMDEVYLEQPEEDLAEGSASPAAGQGEAAGAARATADVAAGVAGTAGATDETMQPPSQQG